MFLTFAALLGGLAVLLAGAEALVRGSCGLAARAGIPPIVVGLTIVAFGTSAPELVVNLVAALGGTPDVAVGNVIGSNTVNILIILGLSAAIVPLAIPRETYRKEIPFALLAVLMVSALGADRWLDGASADVLSRADGLALIGFFAVFLAYTVSLALRGGGEGAQQADAAHALPHWKSLPLVAVGLGALFLGGKWFVGGAIDLARLAGLSEMFIGLTVVAVGTSLPEMATSILAARRGQNDIAIGNVVGSNIFNIFWILGVTAVITPVPLAPQAWFDLAVCAAATVSLLVLPLLAKGKIARWQGWLLAVSYAAYVGYLLVRG